MHVPLVIAGPGVAPGVSDTPVSTRRIFHTILDWAGLGAENSLRGSASSSEVVLGEAMKPFLEYGWQPQVMSVGGPVKAILAGKLETYDLAADPKEARNLGAGANIPAPVRAALEDYPVPSPAAARPPDNLDADAKRRLASLGYVSSGAAPLVRKDAPRPADMSALFEPIEKASGLFAAGQYAKAIPLIEHIRAADPHNLAAVLQLAAAHSALGHNDRAVEIFREAAALAPASQDVRLYLGLHYVRTKDWDRAASLLEAVVAESPERLTAAEGLATVRAQQGDLAMQAGQTAAAIVDFERARALQPGAFTHNLELGVLYLAARRFEEARAALDRVPPSDPGYPMALFKRAQVSVLLHEPDAAARIAAARAHADAATRPLIAREKLFEGVGR
jgi:Tfp pilus assembly protein PilF